MFSFRPMCFSGARARDARGLRKRSGLENWKSNPRALRRRGRCRRSHFLARRAAPRHAALPPRRATSFGGAAARCQSWTRGRAGLWSCLTGSGSDTGCHAPHTQRHSQKQRIGRGVGVEAPAHMRPITRQPAMEVCTTGMCSASSASNTEKKFS